LPRLFVAVWPPDALIRDLTDMPRPASAGVRWTRPDQWHVTLVFLGSIDEGDLAGIGLAIGSVVADFSPAVEARAGPAPSALSGSVWALPVYGLDGLASALRIACAPWLDPRPDRKSFRGHLTLARSGRRAPPSTFTSMAAIGLSPLACRWTVPEVTLVASRTLSEGALYEVVARWPLRT
jgi:RNA 2',3'-cyclic 3'-phosphodiesterase